MGVSEKWEKAATAGLVQRKCRHWTVMRERDSRGVFGGREGGTAMRTRARFLMVEQARGGKITDRSNGQAAIIEATR